MKPPKRPLRIMPGQANLSAGAFAQVTREREAVERGSGPPNWLCEFFLENDRRTSMSVTTDEVEAFEAESGERLASDVLSPEKFAAFAAWLEGPAETSLDRLELIHRVLIRARDECESWRDGFLGVQLAYLALAIAQDGHGFVDWSPAMRNPELTSALTLFREWFPPDDPVWDFIRTD